MTDILVNHRALSVIEIETEIETEKEKETETEKETEGGKDIDMMIVIAIETDTESEAIEDEKTPEAEKEDNHTLMCDMLSGYLNICLIMTCFFSSKNYGIPSVVGKQSLKDYSLYLLLSTL